ncbi:MAG: GNAT family N-acetyltransferase [Rhizobiaceae bacterium]
MRDLATVRRLEAAGFCAFPAGSVRYDGTWALRTTKGVPAKRVNSINPLDPNDTIDFDTRIARASELFREQGQEMIFRISPLAPDVLVDHLQRSGWCSFDESIVMAGALSADLGNGRAGEPVGDAVAWAEAMMKIEQRDASGVPALVQSIAAARGATGLFLTKDPDGHPTSTVRCVADLGLAGIFELATDSNCRRRGYGRAILSGALSWARARGASTAWLQVTAVNAPAISLYQQMGMHEVYRYSYWRKAK